MNRHRSIDLGDGYVGHFTWSSNGDELFVQVSNEGTLVSKDWFGKDLACRLFGPHEIAARWVRREVGRHKRAMRILQERA
jgi:hypothetical protein